MPNIICYGYPMADRNRSNNNFNIINLEPVGGAIEVSKKIKAAMKDINL